MAFAPFFFTLNISDYCWIVCILFINLFDAWVNGKKGNSVWLAHGKWRGYLAALPAHNKKLDVCDIPIAGVRDVPQLENNMSNGIGTAAAKEVSTSDWNNSHKNRNNNSNKHQTINQIECMPVLGRIHTQTQTLVLAHTTMRHIKYHKNGFLCLLFASGF